GPKRGWRTDRNDPMPKQREPPAQTTVRRGLLTVELTGFEVLSEDERAVQEAMHRFARDVMRPAGVKIDRLSAEEAVSPGSPYWEFIMTTAASGIEFDAAADGVPPEILARAQAVARRRTRWGERR